MSNIKYYKDTDISKEYAKEYWRPVVGYEGKYEVSSLGRVKTLPKQQNGRVTRLLKPAVNRFGYVYVMLSGGKHIFVHRLVAEAFIFNHEKKPFVNHINGCKVDNYLWNLEWCTASENQKHGFRTGLMKPQKTMLGKKGALCPNSKPINQYLKDGTFVKK